MTDEGLKNFLKENIQEPAPSSGEASRIWRHIEDSSRKRTFWWALIPAMATSLALVFVLRVEKTLLPPSEEEYLYQEWSEVVRDVDVDTDVEQDFVSVFEN